ncbi:MAG: ABC transporter permease [Desulfurococcales archaeon]|nr:ABC transporter permease [Desulfurococcales archaeon]
MEAVRAALLSFAAEVYMSVRVYKNNPSMLFTSLTWPYLMVFVILVLGSSYGSLDEFSRSLGVTNPIFFLFAASGIAFTAVSIVDYGASFAAWYRWLGVLPYIVAGTPSLPAYLAASGLARSLLNVALTYVSITPAVILLGGLESGVRMIIVIGVLISGMIPLVGLAVVAAMLTVMVKVESDVLSFINPLLLLLSGVFYPIALLPDILEVVAALVPISYIVEASKIAAAFEAAWGGRLYSIMYILGLMAVAYNLVGLISSLRLERSIYLRGSAA